MYAKRLFSALILCFFISASAHAQTTEHEGIRLYKLGKTAEAEKVLSSAVKTDAHRSNAEMWNFLGLSLLARDDYKAARKAFDKANDLNGTRADFLLNIAFANLMMRETDKAQTAVKAALKLDPANPSAYYLSGTANLWEQKLDDAKADADKALAIDPAFVQAYVLHSNILVARLGNKLLKDDEETVQANIDLLRQARDVLRDGSQKTTASPNRKLIENELAAMEAFHDFFTKDRPAPGAAPDPSITPLNVIKKRPARYTDQARQSNIQGTIRMAILFGASGRIEHKLILKRLGFGLDQQALAAANDIVFEPQKKDGKPVSTVKILEYTFTIY